MVEMAPPISLAEPEKRAVLQPDRIDARVLPSLDPCLARLPENRPRVACSGVGAVEVEPRLRAVLNLINDLAAVRCPAHADDEEIFVLGGVKPPHAAFSRRDDAEPNGRIGVAGLWIVRALDDRMVGNVIDEGVFRDGLFVELQKRDARRIRTPPIGAIVAATVKLFGVHPVERAVEQCGAAIRRQCLFS